MVAMRTYPSMRGRRGTSLIEVLVTIAILAIGLLGLARIQAFLQVSEVDAYQRSQALMLLNDMVSRMANNRSNAADYVTTSPLGTGTTCPGSPTTRQQSDSAEWCNALQGAGETVGSSKIGAMTGGRGCVQDLGGGDYLVTVAWQGLAPTAAPPSSVTCGQNSYDGTTGSACVNDLCRRAVTTIVRIATL
jgi:type IV pilus assembly protein PilV